LGVGLQIYVIAVSETKKRLLLSKWRGEVEELREKQADHEDELAGRDWQIEVLEATLESVKYWLHDGLVMHRLVSDPRQLLRKIEDTLS
jgi:hypothetical protein